MFRFPMCFTSCKYGGCDLNHDLKEWVNCWLFAIKYDMMADFLHEIVQARFVIFLSWRGYLGVIIGANYIIIKSLV